MSDTPQTPAGPAVAHEGQEGQEQFAATVAQALEGGERVKVRLILQLYDSQVKRYVQWKGQNHRLALDPQQAQIGDRFSKALDAALQAIGRLGPEQFCHVVDAATVDSLPLSGIEAETQPPADEEP